MSAIFLGSGAYDVSVLHVFRQFPESGRHRIAKMNNLF